MTDWNLPPINANYLGFGYAVEQNGQFIVFGYFYNTSPTMPSIQQAQVFGKPYTGTLDEAGVTRVAHQYAADILAQFGGKSLVGTRIVFVSDRTGNKEIWSMNYDGTDQRQITHYNTISTFPSVSPDGKKLAFTSWLRGRPEIVMFSLDTLRRLPFYNQQASMNAFVDVHAGFASESSFRRRPTAARHNCLRPTWTVPTCIACRHPSTIEVEPKINPKTGAEIAFVSGRTGLPQVYRMSMEGTDLQRLSNGEGEATNPAWAPDGQHLAFAWTKGFEPGNYNIFVMDVPTRNIVQLTSNEGRNENPSWAPDNAHIAYASKRGAKSQIWVMGADGRGKQQLTNQGSNEKPVWVQAVQ